MIYVPEDYNSSSFCAYMQSNNVLRVYTGRPTNGSTLNYRDFMVDNHYLYRDGVTTFNQYSTLPTCLSQSDITSFWGYRTDLADILVCLMVLLGFMYFVLSRPLKLLFRGWNV